MIDEVKLEATQGASPAERLALEVKGLWVEYQGRLALDEVSLGVTVGHLVGLIGPNGAGKSTLFKALLGLVPVRAGEVRLFGDTIERSRRLVAYVPQREAVNWTFPITVQEVVMMGRFGRLGWFRYPGPADRRAVERALEQVGMLDLRQRRIGHLSGGQQQRVFLARALAQEADLLLLDEPFSGVDSTTQEAVLTLLDGLREMGKTTIVATHDLSCLGPRFDTLICLNRKLIDYGPRREVFTAETLRRTFGGQLLILEQMGAA